MQIFVIEIRPLQILQLYVKFINYTLSQHLIDCHSLGCTLNLQQQVAPGTGAASWHEMVHVPGSLGITCTAWLQDPSRQQFLGQQIAFMHCTAGHDAHSQPQLCD